MPRHRKECGPKHGALRRERSSRRSVVPRAPAFGPGFGRDAGRALRGDLVGYQVVRRWRSGFMAVITIPAAARARAWSLRFAFPAAHVDRVWGARWQPFGDGDGGTANGPLQWPGHSREPGGMGADQMMVSATGTPGTPSGCTLDGISCRFG